MVFPSSLSTMVAKIQVSSNEFKLIANRDTVKSGSILTVPLPNNGICDLKSYFMSADLTTSAEGSSAFAVPARWLPLFSRIIVEVGGQTLNSCQYLPEVQTTLHQVADSLEQRNRKIVYGGGAKVAAPTSNVTAQRIVIDEFPATFLESTSSPLMDMSLLPDVKLHFYLDSGNVALIKNAAATGASFELANVYASIKSYAIEDGGRYYSQVDSYLKSSGETKDITWVNYMTTLNTATINSTTCLDVQSNSVKGAFFLPLVKQGELGLTDTTTGTSAAFTRAVSGDLRYQFSLNGITNPLYQASASDAWAILGNALGHKYNKFGSIDESCATPDLWLSKFFVGACSFELPVGFNGSTNWVSGYNTLDSCSKLSVTTSGTSAGSASILLAVMTNPILKISANKSFVVVP